MCAQAEHELSSDWTLMKAGMEGVPKVLACSSRCVPA
jgi:hypothetical protein